MSYNQEDRRKRIYDLYLENHFHGKELSYHHIKAECVLLSALKRMIQSANNDSSQIIEGIDRKSQIITNSSTQK